MYSTFLLASPLFKTEKLMKQKKVKARMTPSKSHTPLSIKRDEKRHAEGVLTKSIFVMQEKGLIH
ncbi:hypothetical protein T4D_7190 [Trichinella pseudospiralis]|uniref:Uncharacterized protein n=1 Tax=Trichinella pseudospiralis TaxID=6337 RepID=A0A0V1FAC8_TRIPS|nr:hypothetical protein T4D_7190 [Trichinella pseudospiralis]